MRKILIIIAIIGLSMSFFMQLCIAEEPLKTILRISGVVIFGLFIFAVCKKQVKK